MTDTAAIQGLPRRFAPEQLRALAKNWPALAVAGYIAATMLTFLARHHWLADLVANLRPHLLIVAGTFAALLVASRHGCWILPLAATAAVHGAVLLWPMAGPNPTVVGPTLRLMTFNLLHENTAYARTLAYIRDQQPDILVLEEASRAWKTQLSWLGDRLRFTTIRSHGGGDTVVISRFPIRSIAVERPTGLERPPDGLSALRVELLVDGERVLLWAVHPPSSMGAALWRMRNDYHGWVADRIRAEDPLLPVLVAGDFNQTPWTPWHEEFLRRSGLIDAAGTRWSSPTWHPFGPLAGRFLGIPIDQDPCTARNRRDELRVGPELGSDHYPVTADLVLEWTTTNNKPLTRHDAAQTTALMSAVNALTVCRPPLA